MARGSAEVVSAMGAIGTLVEESHAATGEMAAQAGGVTATMDEIASVADQQRVRAADASASTEELMAQTEELAAQARELSHTATSLTSLVARFRLTEAVESAPATRPELLRAA